MVFLTIVASFLTHPLGFLVVMNLFVSVFTSNGFVDSIYLVFVSSLHCSIFGSLFFFTRCKILRRRSSSSSFYFWFYQGKLNQCASNNHWRHFRLSHSCYPRFLSDDTRHFTDSLPLYFYDSYVFQNLYEPKFLFFFLFGCRLLPNSHLPP